MDKELSKYIEEGLSITKVENGYEVFTVPTQRFKISSLDDLNKDSFERAVKEQEEFKKNSK